MAVMAVTAIYDGLRYDFFTCVVFSILTAALLAVTVTAAFDDPRPFLPLAIGYAVVAVVVAVIVKSGREALHFTS
jgi:hypothetical protein